jgi:hypothetical protein
LPEDEKNIMWDRIFKGACQTLLVNEYTLRLGGMRSIVHQQSIEHDNDEPVRGCLQAYARSAHTRIWVPMGLEYRKLLSCTHPRHKRYL